MNFSKELVYWYLKNKRELPWRQTTIPYYIWLSEIILQQTRIDQGLPYYNNFIFKFPTINHLAAASEEEVLKLWQGLGYYSRARNLHSTAIFIVNELQGKFPSSYAELLKLKGVGDYTASAIASICFNEKTAVVDGNVYRVLARYFGVETPINSSKGKKEFKNLAQELLNEEHPGTYNQAVMEFGARMCTPQIPQCNLCTLNKSCIAYNQNRINKLPVKTGKTIVKTRFFNYLVVETINNCTHLEKRKDGIWKNLYQFPLIETDVEIDENDLLNNLKFVEIFKDLNLSLKQFNAEPTKHKLSHQTLFATFWIVKINTNKNFAIPWSSINKYPVPKLIEKFLMRYKTKE